MDNRGSAWQGTDQRHAVASSNGWFPVWPGLGEFSVAMIGTLSAGLFPRFCLAQIFNPWFGMEKKLSTT
jgi:hypothetical protein